MLWICALVLAAAVHTEGLQEMIGGASTTIAKYSSIGSLQYNGKFLSCVSIISDTFALTPAHSTNGKDTARMVVRVGTDNAEESIETYAVESITEHESFQSNTLDNDVAVIKLKGCLVFSPTVKPIEISPSASTEDLCFVVGYGYDHKTTEPQKLALQAIPVRLYDAAACKIIYNKYGITDSMVCADAHYAGKGSYQGNTGACLICGDKLVGIASWGFNEGPTVYTNVVDCSDFIKEYVEAESSPCAKINYHFADGSGRGDGALMPLVKNKRLNYISNDAGKLRPLPITYQSNSKSKQFYIKRMPHLREPSEDEEDSELPVENSTASAVVTEKPTEKPPQLISNNQK